MARLRDRSRPNTSLRHDRAYSRSGLVRETLLRLAGSCLLVCFVVWPQPAMLRAETPPALHARIDAMVSEAEVGPVAERTEDAEFLRRLSLDLVGRIPTTKELAEFLEDGSPGKREQWIDRLLASPECDKHLAVVLDVSWMERRADTYVGTPAWRTYLRDAIAANRPLDELVAEVLAADGADEATKVRAKFLLDRNVEAHLLTRDVGRLFFGRDLQCAQCHDHPLVSDYAQSEYYGLFAFLQRTHLVTQDVEKKLVSVGEKADGEAVFASVFEPDVPQRTSFPVLPDGSPLVEEPAWLASEAYVVAPAEKVRPVPRFSRRGQLASADRLAGSRLFRLNAANRLWRLLLKRGLVEPPDLMHAANPPTHPLLLEELAGALIAQDFQIKPFLAQVARSQVYQRRMELPVAPEVGIALAAAARKQAWETELPAQRQLVERLAGEVSHAFDQLADAEKELQQHLTTLRQKLAEVQAAEQKRVETQGKWQQAEDHYQKQVALLASLKLAAEQAQAAAGRLEGDQELAGAVKLLAARATVVEQQLPQASADRDAQQAALTLTREAVEKLSAELGPLRQKQETLVLRVKEQAGGVRSLRELQMAESVRGVEWTQRLEQADVLLAVSQAKAAADNARAVQAEKRQRADQQQASLAAIDEETRQRANERDALQVEVDAARRFAEAAEARVTGGEQLLAAWQQSSAELAKAEAASGTPASGEVNAGLQDAAAVAVAVTEVPLPNVLADARGTLERQVAVTEVAVLSARQQFAQDQQRLVNLESRCAEVMSQCEAIAQRRAVQQAACAEADAAAVAAEEATRVAEVEQQKAGKRLRQQQERRFAVASLQGLSPEQLSASVVVALGLDERFRAEATSDWEGKNKEKPPAEIDAAQKAAEIEAAFQSRCKQVEDTLVSLFAAPPGTVQDAFQATVDQALFWDNDGRVHSWVAPSGGNLAERLVAQADDGQVTDQVYRSLVSRSPTSEERRVWGEYLSTAGGERPRAIQDMIWSLLTSIEFRFNH